MDIEKYKSFKNRLMKDSGVVVVFLLIVLSLIASLLTSESGYLFFILPLSLVLIINSLSLKNYLTEAKVEDGVLNLSYFHFSEKRTKQIPVENLKVRTSRSGRGDHHFLIIKENNKTVLNQAQSSGDWNKELLFKTYDYLTAEIDANKK